MLIEPVGKTLRISPSAWYPRHDGTPPFVWHPEYSVPWPANHRFAMWKFSDLRLEAEAVGLTRLDEFFVPSEASTEALASAHELDYIRQFEADTLPREIWRRIGFTQRPDHAALVRRTRLEVGGTLLAAELARTYGMACNLAGGTHHAHRAYGAGYTVYNDLAVTAIAHSPGKSLVCDVDVHQGDGTAEILDGIEDAFTFSIHCQANYPFGFKMDHLGHDTSDLDVALPPGAADADVLYALQSHLPRLLDNLRPTLVLFDAGVDADAIDKLGKLQCSPAGMFARDKFVLEQCVLRRIPVVTVIGGGYDHDRWRLARRHAIVLHAATRVWRSLFRNFLS